VAEPSPNGLRGGPDWCGSYLRARQNEGRLLPDSLVAALPHLPRSHPLSGEWRRRADSSSRLLAYLRALRRPLTIVDVGCGNGWLANRMAELDGCRVVGVDVNAFELNQARRVFGHRSNLAFVQADIQTAGLPLDGADVVVLASVIQYLPDPAALLSTTMASLGPRGEVHVFDSPIYRTGEVQAAEERTRQHYMTVGVPEMADVYVHHDWSGLDSLDFDVLYRPDTRVHVLQRRLLRRPGTPFPWLRFRSGGDR
jgi:SAM-dependent methyltransferase